MQWVRANGGIKDTGGDLAQMFRDNGRQPPPGIIANRNGQAADVLVQRAREAGYFPDVIDDEGRPDELTSDHLIGAIQDEINGTPRFSENDRMSVEAHDAAKAYNENIRNLAGLHGIDFRGTTLDAFHAAVAHSEMKMRAEDLGIVLKGDESPAKVAALVHEKELSQSSPEQYAAQADAIDRYLDARFGTDLPDALDDLPWADEDAHTAAKAGVSQGEASRPSEGGPGREKPDGPAAERDGTGPVGEGRGRDDDTGVGGEQSPHATEADDQNGLGFGESAKIKDWPAELARVRARAEQWRSTAARLSEPRAVRFQHPNGLAALTGPDVSKPGGFRATYFRDGDPVGHVEFPTHRDAIYDTLREGFRPTEESALQRGPGGMAPLRAALKSGNIKRGAQAVIDRMRLQAGLDDSYNIKNPDRARPAIDRADIREVENFIDFIGHHMFDDVGLRILKGGEGGTLGQYNAYNHIVSLFREAVAGGDVSRTMVHELWHSLERVLPRGDYAAVTREYLNQQRKWLAKNEWARPFLANGELQDRLTGAKGEAWLNEHEADPAAMRNVEVLTNDKGEKIGAAIRWTSDNYRFKNREEYWAETMADKYFNAADLEDAKARSVFGHVRAIYNQMVDGVKRAFGGDATGRIFEGFRDHDYSPGENPDNPYVAGQYDVRRTPTTERTDQGDQFVMPGTERSAVQAAAARGDKATTAAKQKPADFGLFAQPEKPQPSLFDPPKPAKTAPAEEGLPAAKAVETKLDPHQRAADFVIQKGKQDGNEHMVIIDPVSQLPLASTSDGRVDGVSIPASIMVKIADPNERLVIHHNHPGGTALSTPDATLLHFPGLSWIVAHTHDGEFSGARLTDAARAWALSKPSILRALAIKNMATRAYNQTVAMAREAYNAGKATSSDLNAVVSEFTQRALHAAGLTEYVSSHDTSFIPQELHDQIVNSAANAVKIESRRYGINLADADRPAEPVRPKEAIGRLPGSDDVDPQAVATGNSGRDQGGKEGAQYATKQPPPIPDRRGQYALLESTSPQELRESPSAKEVFDRAAATIASSRGPMRTPERLARAVSETAKDSVLGRVVRRVVTPGAFDDTAKIAARGIRQVFGQMYVNDLQAAHALKKGEEALDKMSTAEKNAFAMAIDEGGKQATPELQAIADNLRRETQKATSRLQALGILEDARENYLGRIWKPRGQAVGADTSRAVLAALSNKTPLKGPASFLKQRHYDTYREALAAGLEPQFDNPIRTQLVKISEMNRFYAGALVSDGAKKSGLAKFFSHLGDVPEGWVRLEGPEFKRPQMRIKHEDGETSFVPEGNWYAPEGFARVMNNFQSRGLKGTVFAEPAEYLRAASNAMNSFQLGVSAFHPVFTSLDAQFSRVGIGIDQAMRGEFGKAAGNILGGISPTNWYTNIKAGDDFLKMILDPSNATPEQQRLVNAFGSAGGRVFMQRVLAPTDEGMIKVWKSGAFGRAIRDANAKYPGSPIRATLNVVGRTLETTSAPVMDYVVPRQKLGVFSRLAKDWIDSHPDATNTEFVAAMQDRWDSVDNRLGQMVYDNLFWDKTLKDIAFITTRSVGWNLGSMREIGGGLADAGKFLYNAAALNSPQWTHRMSYLMALTTGSMMMGAMINYMFTGQAPHELKDYFYPRTGLMRTDGMPDRMQLPTYMKDVFAYSHDPFKTLANKESPLLSFINQLVSGHDYYGDLIANKDDPIMKQVEDVMGFAASQFVPFSFQGTYRMFKERPGPTAAMGMLGFTPAPGYIANPMREQMYEQKQHKADATKTVHGQARRNIIAPLKPMPPQERAAGGRVQHDQAAAMADPNPTVPQIEANNYRHGHLRVHGLDVSIETAKGGVRKGVGKDGKPWKVTMPSHYGYFKGTVGADSEHVDCFVGFFPKATHVYVVDQLDPETREFDEHKCLVFFPSLTSALTAYRRSYSDGKGERRIGNVRTMSIAEFKDWLKHGDTTRSIAA